MKKTAFFLALLLVLLLPPPAAFADDSRQYVYDTVSILSEDEAQSLRRRAAGIGEEYGCGIYIVIVGDYLDYADGVTVSGASEAIYLANDFGLGDDRSGVLLLLSMSGRDYDICAYGYGNEAFTDYGKEALAREFLDNFRRDDWYGGLSDYVETCGDMLRAARDGSPVDAQWSGAGYAYDTYAPRLRDTLGTGGLLLVIVGIPCLVALIACGIMKGKMKSVAKASGARPYAVPGGLELHESSDVFTHITESRVRIESDSDRGGGRGGGGTSVNSGGFSHSSGKF